MSGIRENTTTTSPGSPLIYVEDQAGNRQEKELKPGECLTIGRSSVCDLRVDHKRVSRIQCMVREKHGQVILRVGEDAHQALTVNGKAVAPGEEKEIGSRDAIAFAACHMGVIFVDPQAAVERSGLTETETLPPMLVHGNDTTEVEEGVDDGEADTADRPSGTSSPVRQFSDPAGGAETAASLGPAPLESLSTTRLTGRDDPSLSATIGRVESQDPRSSVTERTRVRSTSAAAGGTITGSDQTLFMPQEDVARSLREAEQTKHPLKILLLGAIAALALMLVWMITASGHEAEKTDPFAMHDGGFFTMELPRSWTIEAKDTVVLCRDPGRRAGLAVFREAGSDMVWSSYERIAVPAIEDALGRLKLDHLDDAWCLRSYRDDMGQDRALVVRTTPTTVPYALLDPVSPPKQELQVARIYLDGDVLTGLVAWYHSGYGDMDRVMASFDLKSRDSIWIDRSIPTNQIEIDLQALLHDAEIWYAAKDSAPGNAWRAYASAHAAYAALVNNPEARDREPGLRDDVWRKVLSYAGHLDTMFLDHRARVLAAQRGGRGGACLRAIQALKEEFPDRSDYRWRWAEQRRQEVLRGQDAESSGFFF